ncbi:hypothetical protein [Galbibacter orientalis]|uniref:hypothetical protein n=1 Tax=Galbibacter orientalis TaxID=453852 RepID=UPI0030801060
MKNLKTKMYRCSAFIMLFSFCMQAQKQAKNYKESFEVNKDAVVEVNTSYADVTFETWNKNRVEVEATIEIEDVSKEEAAAYFKEWGFEAEGNANKVKISTANGVRWSQGNKVIMLSGIGEMDFVFPDSIPMPPMPPMPPMDSMMVMAPMPPMPPLPFNFDSFSFDYEAYKKDGDKYLKEWKEQFNESFDDEVKANLEEWKKDVKEQQEEWKSYRKEIIDVEKEARKASEEARKASVEARKAMQEAQQEIHEIRRSANSGKGNRVFYYNSSEGNNNLKVKKTIKIKIPKGVKLKMDVRHGEVTLADNTTNIKATLSYTRLHAPRVEGENSVITASYSPISVDYWEEGELSVNYVELVSLKHVNSIKLTSKSSNVQIQDFFGDAIINGSFGDLSVDQISNNFNTLNIILDNSEAVLTLPKAAFNFYSNVSNSMMKYPKGLTLDVSKRYDNEVANGYYAQKNSNKTINLVATFSDVVLK